MSFRLRALALIMLVVVVSTAVTAWLTLTQASRQVRESVTAGQQETNRITTDLRRHGQVHGGWDGVDSLVHDLATTTGQRIRLTTGSGALLADSDVLAGQPARPVAGPPILVDPRPELVFPDALPDRSLPKIATIALWRYRSATDYARCLTKAGVEVTVGTDADGITVFTPVSGHSAGCVPAPPSPEEERADVNTLEQCLTAERIRECVQSAFSRRIDAFAPAELQVYLGALDESSPSLAAGPVAAVAAAVAFVAILGALLLSRSVLRPIRALTAASRGVGTGDLSRRVPVSGRDEIAELGRSFNRMAGDLQAAEERQRRLVGDVAHELRTPLANLRGYLEAMRDGVIAPTPELVESLHEEVLLQQRIVDDLQDLALAEAGALTYHRIDLDAAELLEGCAFLHRPLALRAGLALRVDARGPAVVHADPDRLRQVLANLVTNAVRATAPGGAVVLALTGDDETVVLSVRDSGTGIGEHDLPHVFDRFWRGDAARGRSTGGSGLGLAIVRQIVTDHGGTVAVTSTPGIGTTFTITLRRVRLGNRL
ncbi:two-component system sensor histidine kinase BaeS [Saccharothrix ecbatanensis]|uniref:histidine kinase n=1 Tax=Saccharothrix ecbatanensis TaxID=1105145 RepID=A0A7W9HFI8_9PSEU|nr:ATP-binding protein [Saccharothrix ecbatanensis]MBB5801069.1 two-component system sensor histidine kinase BaeS [Saccharothrix ecbatanensis]